jgi:hypothetical protein
VSEPADFTVRLVLRPDRRQDEDRRAPTRGGRRASDQPAFGLSSSADVHDLWTVAVDCGWPGRTRTITH